VPEGNWAAEARQEERRAASSQTKGGDSMASVATAEYRALGLDLCPRLRSRLEQTEGARVAPDAQGRAGGHRAWTATVLAR
jgi:hypothetical protein